jgi:hypothetical protein
VVFLSRSINTEISFHEASLVEIHRLPDGTLCMSFEGVHLLHQLCEAFVYRKGVDRILRDGSPLEAFAMEEDDAEVLTLENKAGGLFMIIEWTDFQRHLQTTASYSFFCSSVTIETR